MPFNYLEGDDMLPAVIITRRECLLLAKGKTKDAAYPVRLVEDCIGCKSCFSTFDCPAMSFDPDSKRSGSMKASAPIAGSAIMRARHSLRARN